MRIKHAGSLRMALGSFSQSGVTTVRRTIAVLSIVAALAHLGLMVTCAWKAHTTTAGSPQDFAFYHALVAGERLTGAGSESFVEDLERVHEQTCPRNGSSLVVLESRFEAALGLFRIRQTWLPEQATLFGLTTVNGFALLAVMFSFSFVAQCVFVYKTYHERYLETFQRPCLTRWVEYATTSPLQVALVAMCVMIRDVQTVGLLVATQFACVLLGFALEFLHVSGDLEEPLDHVFVPSGVLACGVAKVSGVLPDKEKMRSHKQCAARAWEACFVCSVALHVAVWGVLLLQLSAVLEASECDRDAPAGSGAWKEPVLLVVIGQCVLFSCFALVPVIQRIALLLGQADADETLVYGSMAYAVLSVAAKALLGGSYISFAFFFPFATLS
jgi:hypothetical protein